MGPSDLGNYPTEAGLSAWLQPAVLSKKPPIASRLRGQGAERYKFGLLLGGFDVGAGGSIEFGSNPLAAFAEDCFDLVGIA